MKVRYAQGYLFYKPMHVDDFEVLLKDENNMDYRGIYNKQLDAVSLETIMEDLPEQSKNEEFAMQMESAKAPGGFFTYKADSSQELLDIDKSIVNLFGCETEEEFREYVGNTFDEYIYTYENHLKITAIHEPNVFEVYSPDNFNFNLGTII